MRRYDESGLIRTGTGPPPDGFELWRGPSLIDGKEIGVVVTHLRRPPQNRKIGDMVQVWILPFDTEPNEAVATGADVSVCGTCRFRPSADGGCYVPVGTTAQRVWWAWRVFKSYQPVSVLPELIGRKPCRIGAWGDPGAVPVQVWHQLLLHVPSWTAYTHRWSVLDPEEWSWCMASCDTAAEADEARARGWRTFRARLAGDPLRHREVPCPASDEAGARLTCDTCGLCNGVRAGRQPKDIAIIAHGHKIGRAQVALETAE